MQKFLFIDEIFKKGRRPMEQYIKRALGLMVLMVSSCQASSYNKEYDYNKSYLPDGEETLVLTNDSPALDQILKNNTQEGIWAINKRKAQQGKAVYPIPTVPDIVNAMLMNDDGSFVVVGGATTGAGQSMIARFLPDGSYDALFRGDGYAVFDASFAGGANSLSSIISDGTTSNGYFVGGSLPANGGIGHLTYAGTLVTTFGGAGTGIFTAPAPFTTVSGLAMQSSGNIVYTGLATANNFAVNRITPAGVTDTTFTAYTAATMGATGIAIDSQDRVIIVGRNTGTNVGYVYRFGANGGLDTTFNGTGSYSLAAFNVYAVAVLPDNSLIVVGDDNLNSFKVIKLTPAGILDTNFGTRGVFTIRIVNTEASSARSVVILPNGEIAVAGLGDDGKGGGDMQAILLFPEGTLDARFDLKDKFIVPGTVVINMAPKIAGSAVKYQNSVDSGLVIGGVANQNVVLVFLADAAIKNNL